MSGNTFARDAMASLWTKVAETTSINLSFSKGLDVYNMDSETNLDENGTAAGAAANGNVQDQEWIPMEYRFDVLERLETSDADFKDITDRMFPVRREQCVTVPFEIKVMDLRNPGRKERAIRGTARDIANKIDVFAYRRAIEEATMVQTIAGAKYAWTDGVDAENLMLNSGLGKFGRKLYLANTHYASVAKELGANQYHPGAPQTAFEKAQIPNLATFDTMRSDYLLKLPKSTASGVTVNGDQKHTVATYGPDKFYLDNRSMTLNLTGSTAVNMPSGTKFTIEGVNMLHPETYEDTGMLRTFTVKYAVDGSPVIQPSIVVDGPYRNCSAQAGTGKVITILNTADKHPSLFYTPESILMVPGRIPAPEDVGGVEFMVAETDNGIPMRLSYWYDPHKDRFRGKASAFFDVTVPYPEMVGIQF